MAPLLLYNSPTSAPCRAVLLTIRNLHLEVELKELDHKEEEHLKEPFISINPQHTFPTLNDNGFIIWESRAITQYLAESKQTHNKTLISNIPKEKALIQQRLYFDLGTLMPRLLAVVMPVWKDESSVFPEEPKTKVYEALQMLDAMLEQSEWFVGECVTIADLSILATVSTIVAIGADISGLHNLSAWYKRCGSLPGFDENDRGAQIVGEIVKSKLTEPF